MALICLFALWVIWDTGKWVIRGQRALKAGRWSEKLEKLDRHIGDWKSRGQKLPHELVSTRAILAARLKRLAKRIEPYLDSKRRS